MTSREDVLTANECEIETCSFKQCPYKKYYKYREDGFCIINTYENADRWIEEDQEEIKELEIQINFYKKRIKRYKKLKEVFKYDK